MRVLRDSPGSFSPRPGDRAPGPPQSPAPPLTAQQFEQWFRGEIADGRSPDSLRRYTEDEVERFWAHTIAGLDGHVYWDGPEAFKRNDGKTRRPLRWVWEREHGAIPVTTDVWTTCGETNCIALGHITAGRSVRRHRYQREQMLGFVQVAALRLGRPPSTSWWTEKKMRPNHGTIVKYFGSWARYLRAAGLDPSKVVKEWTKSSPEEAVAAFRAVEAHIGHPPTDAEFRECREWLKERGLNSSHTTVRRQLECKTWLEVMHKMVVER